MGKLVCSCGAEAEGKTFKEADDKINHGIALLRGNGCDGNPEKMTWNGKPIVKKTLTVEEDDEAPKEKPKKDKPKDK